MYLYINTSSYEKIVLALLSQKGRILELKKTKAAYQQSEKLLANIEKILSFANCQLANVRGIIVIKGPGGFTSLRIGVVTANTLAWSLQIPIVGIMLKSGETDEKIIQKGFKKIQKMKKFRQTFPKYGKEPNITLKRKSIKI